MSVAQRRLQTLPLIANVVRIRGPSHTIADEAHDRGRIRQTSSATWEAIVGAFRAR